MNSGFLQKTSDSDEDPVTLMLQKTGCIDLHYKVQVVNQKTSILIDFFNFKSKILFYNLFRSVLRKLEIGGSVRTS